MTSETGREAQNTRPNILPVCTLIQKWMGSYVKVSTVNQQPQW